MENKYFTPNIEDLYVGYVCEHTSNMGAFECNDTDRIVKDSLSILDLNQYLTWSYQEEGGLKKFIRTKYLDSLGIESLGWEHVGGQMISLGRQNYEKSGIVLKHFPRFNSIFIAKAIDQNVLDGFYDKLFEGECKSINELKKIQQYLNIK